MKKMFVVSLVLAAALAMGCSKKNAQTTPTGTDTKTEMKKDGSGMGGDSYGGAKTDGGGAADPCAAPK
jgi:hypothetical protein